MVEHLPELFDGCDVMIRKYPYSWGIEQKEGIARLKRSYPLIKVGEGDLKSQIDWCDLAIYDSTSAGIEAMLGGRLAIHAPLHDILSVDCTVGKAQEHFIYKAKNVKQLKDLIMLIKSMDDLQYYKEVEKQREFAVTIYSPIDKKVLSFFEV